MQGVLRGIIKGFEGFRGYKGFEGLRVFWFRGSEGLGVRVMGFRVWDLGPGLSGPGV